MTEYTLRNAAVTVDSSGIGPATVRALRTHGCNVVAVAGRADKLAALATETLDITHPADIPEDDDVGRLPRTVTDAFANHGDEDTVIDRAGGA